MLFSIIFIEFTCQPQAPAPSVPTAALKDVPKAPIPAEHQILQTHFEGAIKKCLENASNAVRSTYLTRLCMSK